MSEQACATCGHSDAHAGSGIGICARTGCGCDGPVTAGVGFVRIRPAGTPPGDPFPGPPLRNDTLACGCPASRDPRGRDYKSGLLAGWAIGTGCMLVPLAILAATR